MTYCEHAVSESFHSPSGVLFTFPSQYWFTIGHRLVFSLAPWSAQLPSGYLTRCTLELTRAGSNVFYRAITFYGRIPIPFRISLPCPMAWSTTPTLRLVWALPLSLAATDGIDTIFLFLRVLRCFNSPGLAPLQKQSGTTMQLVVGSPIQKSAGRSSHPAHRSLSQVVASFIACRCQGIHCTP